MFRGTLRLCRLLRRNITQSSRLNALRSIRSRYSLPVLGLATAVRADQQIGWDLEKLELAQGSEQLQHEFLLRQACTTNTTSATQLLTTLAVAFHDTSQRLREEITEEIKLTDQLMQWGSNTPEQHFDAMIAHRAVLEKLWHDIRVLSSYLEYVEKLATAVAELSYITGNIIASDIICEQIEHVKRVIKQESQLNDVLHNECLQLQSQVIETSTSDEQNSGNA